MPKHPELLEQAAGKAVKIVSPLLPYLPRGYRYKVIFLDRPIPEIIASQAKMRVHRQTAESPDTQRLGAALSKHRQEAIRLLKNVPHVELLVVPYRQLLAEPAVWTEKIGQFLGTLVPHPEQMADAIQPDLYRNRISSS